MNAEILVAGVWMECRLLQQGATWQAWFEVGVMGDGEPRYEPVLVVVPAGAVLRLRGEVGC